MKNEQAINQRRPISCLPLVVGVGWGEGVQGPQGRLHSVEWAVRVFGAHVAEFTTCVTLQGPESGLPRCPEGEESR